MLVICLNSYDFVFPSSIDIQTVRQLIKELQTLNTLQDTKSWEIHYALLWWEVMLEFLLRSLPSGIDKPKVVSQSQSQKLTIRFSLKSQCPTTHPHPGKFQM